MEVVGWCCNVDNLPVALLDLLPHGRVHLGNHERIVIAHLNFLNFGRLIHILKKKEFRESKISEWDKGKSWGVDIMLIKRKTESLLKDGVRKFSTR